MRNPLKRTVWLDVEIYEQRAGGVIRIVDDKVQRRIDNDGSQLYYLKNAKDTLEPQEFENIFIGSNGKQKLKCFSPTKGVYWPIKFIVTRTREFTEAELKQIQVAEKLTAEQETKLLEIKDKKNREEEKLTLMKNNKSKKEKELYQRIFQTYMETVIDTETLNHAIYKIQKNQLRLQTGKGLSPTVILTLVIIVLAVFIIIASWSEYSYFLKPAMDFWNNQAPLILNAVNKVSCQNPTSAGTIPTPVK